jgi:hypothetical protein
VRDSARQPDSDRRTIASEVGPFTRSGRFGKPLIDRRAIRVAAPVPSAFYTIQRIGGATGWYYANWLWSLRGWLDLLVGGVGVRRGRRDGERLESGDVLDCWRVETVEPNRRLRLVAEMKLPGQAWLEFEVIPDPDGSRVTQTATLVPAGVLGVAYWYVLWPLHHLIFRGMLRNMTRHAERLAARGPSIPPTASS